MFDVEQMRKNRDAGTPGDWELKRSGGETSIVANGEPLMCNTQYYPWCPDNLSDWERIASIPAIEAEIERLTDALKSAEAELAMARTNTVIDAVSDEKWLSAVKCLLLKQTLNMR